MSDPRWRLWTAFALVYVVWGSTYLAIRFAIETLPPFLMAGTRFLVAGAVLYTWARARGVAPPTRTHWLAASVVGLLLLAVGNGGVVWAEQQVPSGLAAVLIATEPFWIVLLDWARPGGPRPTPVTMAGLLCGFLGVAVLISPSRLVGGGPVDLVGAAVLVVASFAWAAGSLYTSRGARLPASPILAGGLQMLAGGAALLAVGSLSGEWHRLDPGAVSLKSFSALAYLIVFGSVVGFTAYVYLLTHTTPARASTYAFVNPVIAVLVGWAVGGEALGARAVLATVAIVGAVVLITASRAAPRPRLARRHADGDPDPAGRQPGGGRRSGGLMPAGQRCPDPAAPRG